MGICSPFNEMKSPIGALKAPTIRQRYTWRFDESPLRARIAVGIKSKPQENKNPAPHVEIAGSMRNGTPLEMQFLVKFPLTVFFPSAAKSKVSLVLMAN